MDIAGHRSERMHERYTPFDADEKLAAARKAFGGLKLVVGGSQDADTGGPRLGIADPAGGDDS